LTELHKNEHTLFGRNPASFKSLKYSNALSASIAFAAAYMTLPPPACGLNFHKSRLKNKGCLESSKTWHSTGAIMPSNTCHTLQTLQQGLTKPCSASTKWERLQLIDKGYAPLQMQRLTNMTGKKMWPSESTNFPEREEGLTFIKEVYATRSG
jgi:hypothetical protein